ncbi:MAG: FkbM family methyltransferase, partial [bacterium]|nr:FkbM family methyltransferase [bacterium]
YEPVYERLAARLGSSSGFHGRRVALGSEQGERPLHLVDEDADSESFPETSAFSTLAAHSMPQGMAFRTTVNVEVTTLASLHASGAVPNDVSLVKIDTEGFDLEVIRGMEHHRYPVVLAEYWDEAIPFWSSGLQYTLENLVTEMRGRGYPWHLVLYRIWGHNETACYANHPRAVANSWGNAVFFRDFALFQQAQSWCSAVLPRTYFKSVSG